MTNASNDKDDDFVAAVPSGESCIIIPLLQGDEPRPRNRALFDILAEDVTSEVKAFKRSWSNKIPSDPNTVSEVEICDKNSNEKPETTWRKSDSYRRNRADFFLFICLMVSFSFISILVFVFFVIESLTLNKEELHHYEYAADGNGYLTDDDYSAYQPTNFVERISYFFFGDGGFNSDFTPN